MSPPLKATKRLNKTSYSIWGSAVTPAGFGAEPRPHSEFGAFYARKRICLQHFWFFGQHLFIYSFIVFIMTSDKTQMKLQYMEISLHKNKMASDIIERWKTSALSTALTIYPCQTRVHQR